MARNPPRLRRADYVPFYFGPKSPMLYAIKQGKVEGYQGQREIVYLVAAAEEIAAPQRVTVEKFERRKPARRPLPEHLPRERVVHPAPSACPRGGSSPSTISTPD